MAAMLHKKGFIVRRGVFDTFVETGGACRSLRNFNGTDACCCCCGFIICIYVYGCDERVWRARIAKTTSRTMRVHVNTQMFPYNSDVFVGNPIREGSTAANVDERLLILLLLLLTTSFSRPPTGNTRYKQKKTKKII